MGEGLGCGQGVNVGDFFKDNPGSSAHGGRWRRNGRESTLWSVGRGMG